MTRHLPWAYGPPSICIDLGSTSVRALQLRPRERQGRPGVLAAAAWPRSSAGPLTSAEFERLRDVLARQGFVGRRCTVVLPSEQQAVVSLRLPPPAAPAPRNEIALAQAADAAGCSSDEIECAWWDAPPPAVNVGSAALGVYTRSARAAELLAEFDRVGLVLTAIDSPAWVLATLAKQVAPAAARATIVDLSHTALQIVTLLGGVPAFHRVLPDLGLAALSRKVAARAGADPASIERLLLGRSADARAATSELCADWLERIAQEVDRSIRYARSADLTLGTERVLLVGPSADRPGVPESLAALLPEASVQRLSLEELVQSDRSNTLSVGSEMALAAGLALRNREPAADHGALINLLPAEALHTRAHRRAARAWSAALASTAVVASAVVFALGPVGRSELATTRVEHDRATADARATAGRLTELRMTLAKAEARLAAARAVSDHPDWSALLEFLALARGDDTVLSALELTRGEIEVPALAAARSGSSSPVSAAPPAEQRPSSKPVWTLQLVGVARSAAAATDLVVRLERAAVFERVQLIETSARPGLSGTTAGAGIVAGELAAFRVECTMGGRAAGANPPQPKPQANGGANE